MLMGMEERVMSPAEQQPVVDLGVAAVFPMLEVVGVAPGGGHLTARPLAMSVPGDDRPADRGGPHAGGPADVEGVAGRVGDDPGGGGVAEELVAFPRVDDPGEHSERQRGGCLVGAGVGEVADGRRDASALCIDGDTKRVERGVQPTTHRHDRHTTRRRVSHQARVHDRQFRRDRSVTQIGLWVLAA